MRNVACGADHALNLHKQLNFAGRLEALRKSSSFCNHHCCNDAICMPMTPCQPFPGKRVVSTHNKRPSRDFALSPEISSNRSLTAALLSSLSAGHPPEWECEPCIKGPWFELEKDSSWSLSLLYCWKCLSNNIVQHACCM